MVNAVAEPVVDIKNVQLGCDELHAVRNTLVAADLSGTPKSSAATSKNLLPGSTRDSPSPAPRAPRPSTYPCSRWTSAPVRR